MSGLTTYERLVRELNDQQAMKGPLAGFLGHIYLAIPRDLVGEALEEATKAELVRAQQRLANARAAIDYAPDAFPYDQASATLERLLPSVLTHQAHQFAVRDYCQAHELAIETESADVVVAGLQAIHGNAVDELLIRQLLQTKDC